MFRHMMLEVACVGLLLAGSAAAQTEHDHSKMQEHSSAADSKHQEGVHQRGDRAMGFSHMKTTHHFRLSPSGGAIEVQANDPSDTLSRSQIRQHLQQISKAFADGDFSAPMLTHDRVPPGVPTLKRLKSEIAYKYVEAGQGGKLLISTSNPEANKAVHEFLRFQIQDHQTGDPLSVQEQ